MILFKSCRVLSSCTIAISFPPIDNQTNFSLEFKFVRAENSNEFLIWFWITLWIDFILPAHSKMSLLMFRILTFSNQISVIAIVNSLLIKLLPFCNAIWSVYSVIQDTINFSTSKSDKFKLIKSSCVTLFRFLLWNLVN